MFNVFGLPALPAHAERSSNTLTFSKFKMSISREESSQNGLVQGAGMHFSFFGVAMFLFAHLGFRHHESAIRIPLSWCST